MKRIIVLALAGCLAAALVGCTDPHDKVVTTDPAQMQPIMEKLPVADKDALGKYMMRHMMGSTFGTETPIPPGTTVKQAIAEQHQLEQAEQQKQDEQVALKNKVMRQRAALQKQLDDVLTVAFVEKKEVSDKYGIRHVLQITLAYANKGTKDIAGVKGAARFVDLFGATISQSGVSYDKTVPAGQTATWTGELDQFADGFAKLRDVDPAKIKFQFEPMQIVFVDGTKLVMPEEP
jgi:hypothetical protein